MAGKRWFEELCPRCLCTLWVYQRFQSGSLESASSSEPRMGTQVHGLGSCGHHHPSLFLCRERVAQGPSSHLALPPIPVLSPTTQSTALNSSTLGFCHLGDSWNSHLSPLPATGSLSICPNHAVRSMTHVSAQKSATIPLFLPK